MAVFKDPRDMMKQWVQVPKPSSLNDEEVDEPDMIPYDDFVSAALEIGYQTYDKGGFSKKKFQRIRIWQDLIADFAAM